MGLGPSNLLDPGRVWMLRDGLWFFHKIAASKQPLFPKIADSVAISAPMHHSDVSVPVHRRVLAWSISSSIRHRIHGIYLYLPYIWTKCRYTMHGSYGYNKPECCRLSWLVDVFSSNKSNRNMGPTEAWPNFPLVQFRTFFSSCSNG